MKIEYIILLSTMSSQYEEKRMKHEEWFIQQWEQRFWVMIVNPECCHLLSNLNLCVTGLHCLDEERYAVIIGFVVISHMKKKSCSFLKLIKLNVTITCQRTVQRKKITLMKSNRTKVKYYRSSPVFSRGALGSWNRNATRHANLYYFQGGVTIKPRPEPSTPLVFSKWNWTHMGWH